MKKKLCILLVAIAVVCIAVNLFSDKKPSAADAIDLNWKLVNHEMLSNSARALEEYDNKTVKWTATVHRIEPDRVVMSDETYNGLPVNPLNVFWDKEELPALDKGDTITVIGTLKFGFPADRIENAYIVK